MTIVMIAAAVMGVSFQSRVFNIGQVILAKKKISLDPMAGSLAGRW
nr:MAG TPA: hypothetical protein [Caudoviricetes sp.]